MGNEKDTPNGASLVERPVNLNGGSTRGGARDRTSRVTVVKNTSSGEDRSGEPRGNHNVVVLTRLVSCY